MLWLVVELSAIGEKMVNIQILQVVGRADNLQRMNSLYDVVENHVGWLAAFELLQETHIVLGEEAKILHTIFEVGDTLYTEAECIAGIYF